MHHHVTIRDAAREIAGVAFRSGDVPSALDADLHARMRPSDEQIEAALAELRAYEGTEATALVPIVFPGKDYGWWTEDTEVEHPFGVFVATDNFDGYGDARNRACEAAARYMLARHGERNGTVGYAVVRPDGTWAVFEDVLSPASHLAFARAEGR